MPGLFIGDMQLEAAVGRVMETEIDAGYADFFRAHYSTVVGTAFLIVQSHARAEEIAQESFIRLLRHWRKVSRYELPEAWVKRVAIRIAVRDARRHKLQQGSLERMPMPHVERGVDPDVIRAIAQLPPKQRAAVGLFYFEDSTLKEVADVLECSESTAGVHLHRARKRLAEVLGEEVPSDAS